MRRLFKIMAVIAAATAAFACTGIEESYAPETDDVSIALDLSQDETKAVPTGFYTGNVVYVFFNDDLISGSCQQSLNDKKFLKLTYDGSVWKSEINQDYLNSLPDVGTMDAIFVSSKDAIDEKQSENGVALFNLQHGMQRSGWVSYDTMTAENTAYEIKDNRLVGKITLQRRVVGSGMCNLRLAFTGLPEGDWYIQSDKLRATWAEYSAYTAGEPCALSIRLQPGEAMNKLEKFGSEYVFHGAKDSYLQDNSEVEFRLINGSNGKVYTRKVPTGTDGNPTPLRQLWRSGDISVTSAGTMSFSSFTQGTTDLSIAEPSNCYIADEAGTYRFNATIRGNSVAVDGAEVGTSISEDDIAGAKLLWQSGSLISGLQYEYGIVSFNVSGTPGNAVVAVTDSNNKVLWSWHIWTPGRAIKEIKTNSGEVLMDMNLGATDNGDNGITVETYGLLYQWGRKDPFPGSPTLTGTTTTMPREVYDIEGSVINVISNSSWYNDNNNTLDYAIANPTVVISNYSHYSKTRDWLKPGKGIDGLWGNTDNKAEVIHKTMFDPCPPGWAVPYGSILKDATTSGGYDVDHKNFHIADVNGDGVKSADDFSYGWRLILNDATGESSFFPATGRYDGSYAMLMGSVAGLWGAYWGNSPYPSDNVGLAYGCLNFQKTSMSPNGGGSRADAYSVRCAKVK